MEEAQFGAESVGRGNSPFRSRPQEKASCHDGRRLSIVLTFVVDLSLCRAFAILILNHENAKARNSETQKSNSIQCKNRAEESVNTCGLWHAWRLCVVFALCS